MNDASLTRDGTRFTGTVAVVLAATFTALALLLTFATAKPSEAQDTRITVDPITIGFGADQVDATATINRIIILTNDGSTALQVGGLDADINPTLAGLNPGDFILLDEVIDPITGLPLLGENLTSGVTLGAGETVQLQVQFKASAEGTRNAVLELADSVGTVLQNVSLTGSGTTTDPFAQPGAEGCTIVGTNNGETITGTEGRDVICAQGGNDKVDGRGGNDKIFGGFGNDRLRDKNGRDRLFGQGGKDRLNVKDGKPRDLVKGGSGKDRAAIDKKDKKKL